MKVPCDEAAVRSVNAWRSEHSAKRTLDSGSDNSRFQHGLYREHHRRCGFAGTPDEPSRKCRRCAMGGRRMLLGGLFGRPLMLLIGLDIFAIASIACTLASNIQQLFISRSAQGVGATFLVPGSLPIIVVWFCAHALID